jgi:hypothetical protein
VEEWWDDGNDTLEKGRAHCTHDHDAANYFILLHPNDKSPSRYFQYYVKPDDVIGIDQFLADVESLDKGLGSASISEFLHMILTGRSLRRIVVDPSPDTARLKAWPNAEVCVQVSYFELHNSVGSTYEFLEGIPEDIDGWLCRFDYV